MKFKQWLLTEAIIDKEEFKDKIDSNSQFSLTMDRNGEVKIKIAVYENAMVFEPKYKSIMATGSLQPLSKNFANVINTIFR